MNEMQSSIRFAACAVIGVAAVVAGSYFVSNGLPPHVRSLITRIETATKLITYDNFESVSGFSYDSGELSSIEGLSFTISWSLADDYLLEMFVDEMEPDGIIAIALFHESKKQIYETPDLVWDWRKWPDQHSPYDFFKG